MVFYTQKNQSPQLKALRAQLKAAEHQWLVELDEKVELRKKDWRLRS